MSEFNDDSSDDWENCNDFIISSTIKDIHEIEEENVKISNNKEVVEEEWIEETIIEAKDLDKTTKNIKKEINEDEKEYKIMILVDFTVLSNGKIHNKFDKYSVNDVDAKVELSKKISKEYSAYANNSELIQTSVVRHCSERVWKDALISLRVDYPGHYWCPIFNNEP
jgi:hypothetical protein